MGVFDDIVKKAEATLNGLKQQYRLGGEGNPWPQANGGFLDPNLLSPSEEFNQTEKIKRTSLNKSILGGDSDDNFIEETTYEKGDVIVKSYGDYKYSGWKGQDITNRGAPNPWPQTIGDNRFLSPLKLYPLAEKVINENGHETVKKFKLGDYKFIDWRGHILSNNGIIIETQDRFNKSKDLPKLNLASSPYSTIDNYLIYGDHSTNYFRHGLQIINGLSPIGDKHNRLLDFKFTPFEKNDPVIFGFDIIIDDISSPLLNGSILDFINNYSNINEIKSKEMVYEDFKQQFIKFFKTTSTVNIDQDKTILTRPEFKPIEAGSGDNILLSGAKSYMSYYLKKISGIDKLVEQNTPSSKKFIVDYNKDVIQLTFSEDVTLSVGTLSKLYKLLYWSKPNGKNLIPENLLRFNCDIIVSEVRNYKAVINSINVIEGSDDNTKNEKSLKIIKDNVSRYIYSLKECQFYFNSIPHPNDIDLSNISVYDNYTMQFDYKYSTMKMERFMPVIDNDSYKRGKYVGYDGGAIWKTGNSQNRTKLDNGQSITSELKSVPDFVTIGDNRLLQNGVNIPFVLSVPGDIYTTSMSILNTYEFTKSPIDRLKAISSIPKQSLPESPSLFDTLKKTLIMSASKELQTVVNKGTSILNKTLNKILESSGITGVNPPKNIYTDRELNAGERIFYDVRGQLFSFIGNTIGKNLGGGGFTGGQFK